MYIPYLRFPSALTRFMHSSLCSAASENPSESSTMVQCSVHPRFEHLTTLAPFMTAYSPSSPLDCSRSTSMSSPLMRSAPGARVPILSIRGFTELPTLGAVTSKYRRSCDLSVSVCTNFFISVSMSESFSSPTSITAPLWCIPSIAFFPSPPYETDWARPTSGNPFSVSIAVCPMLNVLLGSS